MVELHRPRYGLSSDSTLFTRTYANHDLPQNLMSSNPAPAAAWPGVIRRYARFLPVTAETPIVTLLEGNTPLIPVPNFLAAIGANFDLRLKYEAMNPTCSFKDRGMTMVMVTHDIKVANYLCEHAVILEKGKVVDRIDMGQPAPQSLLGKFFFETAKGWTDQTVLPQEDA